MGFARFYDGVSYVLDYEQGMKPGDLVRYKHTRDLIALVISHPVKYGNCSYVSLLWTDRSINDYDIRVLEVASEGR